MNAEELKKALYTPRDSNEMDNDRLATTLGLSFIGYCARPSGIDKDLLQKCCDAFNNNRGKAEWEIAAIKKVLDENRPSKKVNN